MTRRPGLLLSAALTVTVPGMLAVFAVLGHDHSIGGAADTTVGDSVVLSGPFPVAPAKTHASVRNSVATVQSMTGAPVTVLSELASSQVALGMRLLGRAANAGQAISYQGVEQMSESGIDGTVTSTLSEVWHRGGGQTLVQTGTSVSYDADGRAPEGVFGLTSPLVSQLGKHYVAVYRGKSESLGRAAVVVAVYRFDGSLAARFWLDSQTFVPLRRELFDTSDRVVSDDAFVTVRFGTVSGPDGAPGAEPRTAGPAWITAPSPANFVATLSAQGWRLPQTLPGGLPLYAVGWRGTGTGQVIDVEYSDGLYVLSLFVQRGALATEMTGWRPVLLDGRQVYVSGHSVTWAGSGGVYTVIADAPPQTVAQAVAALPQDVPAGILGRLGRGLDRLAQLVNPFS